MASATTNIHEIGLSLHQRFRKDTDIHYPKSLSMQQRLSLTAEFPHSPFITKVMKRDLKRITRHRTQPLTFSEIKEVDEENIDDIQVQSKGLSSVRSNLVDFSNIVKDNYALRNAYTCQNTSLVSGPLSEAVENLKSVDL